jgi:hypothetical protein
MLTNAERHDALRIGAQLLQDKVRPSVERIRIVQGPNLLDADAGWSWPGVVSVALRGTAARVAQSLPGRPFALDVAWTRASHSWPELAEVQRAPYLTDNESAHALCVAARVLRARERLPRAPFTIVGASGRVDAFAVWRWPGLVRIVSRATGELICQSLPGEPFEPEARSRIVQASVHRQAAPRVGRAHRPGFAGVFA